MAKKKSKSVRKHKTSEHEKSTVRREKNGKWLPGQSPNPGGRTKLPADLKAFKNASNEAILRYYHELQHKTREELVEIKNDPKCPFIKQMILGVMLKAAKGEGKALEIIVTRLMGKPVQPVEMSGGLTLEQMVLESVKQDSDSSD